MSATEVDENRRSSSAAFVVEGMDVRVDGPSQNNCVWIRVNRGSCAQ